MVGAAADGGTGAGHAAPVLVSKIISKYLGVGGSLSRSVTGLRFGLAAQPLDESSAASRAGARESD